MFRFLLNAILVVLALRFVLGIARFLSGGAEPRERGGGAREGKRSGGGAREGKRSGGTRRSGGGDRRAGGGDRGTVIDVPYTEVLPEDGETAGAGKAGSGERRS